MFSITAGEIAEAVGGARLTGPSTACIRRVAYDSRRVTSGSLFVALIGANSDGHDFVGQALQAGASAIMASRSLPHVSPEVALIAVDDTRKAMARAACALYKDPTADLRVTAVTGTNGKTSTTHFIESIYRHAGTSCGVIGTLGARINDKWTPVAHTTPESPDLQELFAQMVGQGVEAVALEASSHAIDQNRMDCTRVDAAIFTNLTQDHLDYHVTMEDYFLVKRRLFVDFEQVSGKDFYSIINIDDAYGRERLCGLARGTLWTYGACNDARVRASDLRLGASQTSYILGTPAGSRRVTLQVGGGFNVHNSMAAAASCLAIGVSLDDVVQGLEQQTSVPGRFEPVNCGQEFGVIVDYAHTPDGLQNLLEGCRQITDKRLILVFGCGGDRDPGKRPIMGEIAASLSDLPILTSDNPRSEDPAAIARDVLKGVPEQQRDAMVVELDRRAAIAKACHLAEPGDIVIIAGKGHETYQIFADHTAQFDDRQVVREIVANMQTGKRQS